MSADRESWEPFVAARVGHRHSDPDDMRNTLKLLASFVRMDMLPKSGREFLADMLEKIARGDDPRSIMPRTPRKPRATSSITIMVAVEKEIERRALSSEMADENLHTPISRRFRLGPGTVEKEASKGRARVREAIADAIRSGTEREKALDVMASAIGLSKERIQTFV